jgi:hypothetical protein
MASQLVKQTQNGIREEVGGYPDRVLVILTKIAEVNICMTAFV